MGTDFEQMTTDIRDDIYANLFLLICDHLRKRDFFRALFLGLEYFLGGIWRVLSLVIERACL